MTATETQKPETALEAQAYLESTGCGSEQLEAISHFLSVNADAKATDLVEWMNAHMEEGCIQPGTVKRLGQMVFGPQFQPSIRLSQKAPDEVADLRKENFQLRQQLRDVQAKNHQMLAELARRRQADAVSGQANVSTRVREELPVKAPKVEVSKQGNR